jgi:hypothetical protein
MWPAEIAMKRAQLPWGVPHQGSRVDADAFESFVDHFGYDVPLAAASWIHVSSDLGCFGRANIWYVVECRQGMEVKYCRQSAH